ncbi:LOW QUALITY PROTEIN: beta-alanyl-bioamine nonribosomal peptide synthetase ebony-like, partial [Tachypleus tridentatus]|uniref:LOW QUALITY PROTEIN: beta-alanyl-bioamine nonribosomal peptide synthetase ebony-like n=1 Tax=Tachypleus tridentatus TaxID=6853 RepID=UPI003FCF4707
TTVTRFPLQTAVIDPEKKLTYKELDVYVNRLARSLTSAINSVVSGEKEIILALCMTPSSKSLIAQLAVFKLGAAFVPVDPCFPVQRIRFILKSTKPFCVITESSHEDIIKLLRRDTVAVINVDDVLFSNSSEFQDDEERLNKEPSLAVIMFTSGSTGDPKGIRLGYRNLNNRFKWQLLNFPMDHNTTCSAIKSLTFVDSLTETFPPLMAGRPLVILPNITIQNPKNLLQHLQKHQVTRIVVVPSLLQMIIWYLKIEPSFREDLTIKLWVCSGETLTKKLLTEFFLAFPSAKIANFYGSTETTGDVTFALFDGEEQCYQHIEDIVPIGQPISNTEIYVTDDLFQVVPEGTVGEICVSGLNVAEGYHEMKRKYSSSFLQNPFSNKYDTVYKTGDLGFIKNNTLYFTGRKDMQVKVRGMRVNLEEIRKCIEDIQEIKQVVVCCENSQDLDPNILAFFTPKEGHGLEISDIQKTLEQVLPKFMIPKLYKVDKMPLLVSGKIDKATLKKMIYRKINHVGAESLEVERHVNTNKDIMEIISSILAVGESMLDLNKSFFQNGGSSLTAVETVSKLNEFGYSVDMDEFLTAPSLNSLLQTVDSFQSSESKLTQLKVQEITNMTNFDDVAHIISQSFTKKNPLDFILKTSAEEYIEFLRLLWKDLVEQKLSFVAVNETSHTVGVMSNFDFFNEPQVEPTGDLKIILEMLKSLEEKWRTRLREFGGSWLHNFTAGTHPSCTPAQNVEIVFSMERHVLKLAREKGFCGVFIINSNKMTQDICTKYLDYQHVETLDVQKWMYEHKVPFKEAPSETLLFVNYRFV